MLGDEGHGSKKNVKSIRLGSREWFKDCTEMMERKKFDRTS